MKATYFFKCRDCKKPFALELESREGWYDQPAESHYRAARRMPCPNCGKGPSSVGKMFLNVHRLMGRVFSHQKRDDARVHECDGRCLHAKGPNCDCPCGGVNHGKGMLFPSPKLP